MRIFLQLQHKRITLRRITLIEHVREEPVADDLK